MELEEIGEILGVDSWEEVTEPEDAFELTIDRVTFGNKPSNTDVMAITKRLKKDNSIMELTNERFCNAMRKGVTWCGAVFEGGWGRDYFKSQQLFAIDIDNKTDVLDEDGKPLKRSDGTVVQRKLEPCENMYLSPEHAMERAWLYHLDPVCLYFSMSSTLEHPRFRVVFDALEPVTSIEEADQIVANLRDMFPESDPACTNLTRLWFGSNGEVWDLWRIRVIENE